MARRLAGCGIKSTGPILKTEMLLYQSKANLDLKILFGKITHLIDSEILGKGFMGTSIPTGASF